MSKKILFLDVDGVMCTRRSHLVYGKEGGIWHEWDPLACAAIYKACQHGVQIVVSSTWRKPMHQESLFEKLKEHNLFGYVLFPDWKTPIRDGIRGLEVAEWLSKHSEVESYRILDDDADFLDSQEKFLIRTDPEDGMTSENIKRLLNWAGALKA